MRQTINVAATKLGHTNRIHKRPKYVRPVAAGLYLVSMLDEIPGDGLHIQRVTKAAAAADRDH